MQRNIELRCWQQRQRAVVTVEMAGCPRALQPAVHRGPCTGKLSRLLAALPAEPK